MNRRRGGSRGALGEPRVTAVEESGRARPPRPWLLQLVNAAVAVSSAAICLLFDGPAAWAGGLALVLLVPGDALRRAFGDLVDSADPVVFAMASSLAVVVL